MLALQVACTLEAAWNREFYRAIYWLGTLILTFAIVRGKMG